MGVLLDTDTVSVFKFKETGFVALCDEVTWFLSSGKIKLYDLDIDSARFVEDDIYIKIEFRRNKVECNYCRGCHKPMRSYCNDCAEIQ